jgi:hypothetical protein
MQSAATRAIKFEIAARLRQRPVAALESALEGMKHLQLAILGELQSVERSTGGWVTTRI